MNEKIEVSCRLVLQIVDSPRRDLEWRLYFAYLLAEHGITSVIGSPHDIELYANFCKNALLVGRFGGNSGRSIFDRRLVEALKRNDIDMFFLHDEGAFYFESESEYEPAVRRVYPEEYLQENFFKRLYFWGESQAYYYRNSKGNQKLKVLGSPRFDLFKPSYLFIDEDEVKRITDVHGEFVLICSRFGGLSPVPGDVSLLSKRLFEIRKEGLGDSRLSDSEIMLNMLRVWKNVAIDQALFLSATYSLCKKNPDKNFLFRPHPSEEIALYKNVFLPLPNVKVDKGGDLRPILRAASLMIHSESTSGIEAELAGTPSINFINSLNEDNMSIVGTKLVGYRVSSSSGMEDAFRKITVDRFSNQSDEIRSEVAKHVANFALDVDAINTLTNDVAEFYRNKGASTFPKASKFYLWRKSIAKYWVRKSYLHSKRVLSAVKRSNEGKVIPVNAGYVVGLWRKFGGDKSQLSFSSGVIEISPK